MGGVVLHERRSYSFSSKEEGSGALFGGPAMVKDVSGGGGGVVCGRLQDSVGQCECLRAHRVKGYNLKLFRRIVYAGQSCRRGVAAIRAC